MPQIVHPTSPAEMRVNAALMQLDVDVLKARAECFGTPSEDPSWTRSIEVPMRGPRFLSVVITDGTYCGGPHPNTETTATVYDLRRGEPVNLATLLPSWLTRTSTAMHSTSRTSSLSLASPGLQRLFVAYYGDGDMSAETKICMREILRAAEDGYPLAAWLDAEQRGLILQPGLPHPVQNCAEPSVIPVAELQKQGASPVLLRALEATLRRAAGAGQRSR